MHQVRRTIYILLLVGIACSGCQDQQGVARVPVAGQVSFDGQAVEDGRIRFIPLAQLRAPVCIAFIKGGRYEATDRGGVPVGRHRIEIVAYEPAESSGRQGGFGGPSPRQLLPSQYNKQSNLVLEVTSDGNSTPIIHDFHLKP